MESRSSRRLILSLPAELTVGEIQYSGSIENLSDKGIYMVAEPSEHYKGLSPDTTIKLSFKMLSGEKHVLNCNIKWTSQTPPNGHPSSIGLEIINAPLTYIDQLNKIQ